MKRASRSCLIALGVLWLAACSDESTSSGTGGNEAAATAATVADESPSDSTATESTATTVADLTDVVHNPASGDFVGALEDVTQQTCDQQADGWRVTGKATNPTSGVVDYRIYVSLLNGESTTRALVETELRAVAANGNTTFDVMIPIPDDDLRCVLRVERRAPGA